MSTQDVEYKKTACILCSINCGLEVQVGGRDGRELVKIKGDRDHVSSEGYLCNKAARLNHYQMGEDRITSPMRRTPDGTYEEVDWDTAIREVAERLAAVRDRHGGDKIYFIGGGGQGNHLGAVYARSLSSALGVRYQTNALAQEKTGEFWVGAKMFGGGGPHGDFHHAEVAVFVGKNPWQTHGFPQTRKVLQAIARDPERSMVVLDPSLTDTAKMAEFHLRVRPGTDAWCLSAMIATIVQEDLVDHAFIEAHTDGFEEIKGHFLGLDIAHLAEVCDVELSLLRSAARRIARADSVAVFEDLGTQQNVHSTLVSYLQRIMWVITGNFAKRGTHNISVPLQLVAGGGAKKKLNAEAAAGRRSYAQSPVLGSRVIAGLLPCNEVPDEILTDHPDRFRAAIIQSSNPVHAYADSPRMREAIRALEFSVVIDVAMTETASLADYVLPASSQFEKFECTFFSIEFPRNYFHLRHPVVDPLPGTLPECEIHARLVEALDGYPEADAQALRDALTHGRLAFAAKFAELVAGNPKLLGVGPVLLYRTLGPTLDQGRLAPAALFWTLCHQFLRKHPEEARAAGFEGNDFEAAEAMFQALCESQSGFVYTESQDYADSWNRVGYPDRRIRLHLEELFSEVRDLDETPLRLPEAFPFVLASGNRRATTANTIIRDISWDRKGIAAQVYVSPQDAEQLQLSDGDEVRVTTPTGSALGCAAITDEQRAGTLSIPNGLGINYLDQRGNRVQVGIAPNELTASDRKDGFAGTPWHKFVPARLERA